MKKQTITIKEYGAFCVGKENGAFVNGYCTLTPLTFESLETFILENNKDGADGALELMGLSARRGVGKIITAKNYVGVIEMKDGTTIEILPKLYSQDTEMSADMAKRVLLKMLRTLRSPTYKSFQSSDVDVCKMNVFEIFIRMFTDEVLGICKRGIKSNYEEVEENSTCFKGRIDFAKNIKYNYAHNERVFVRHDEFTVNRPENKLLKSALDYLLSKTKTQRNKKDIKNLLSCLSEVELSTNYDVDFAKIASDRNTAHYAQALSWARAFLKGKSFTSFSGSQVASALLFPMESLFESYVDAALKKQLTPKGYRVSAQDKSYYLFDFPSKKFAIRPDLVITRLSDGAIFVMDTKWKMLSELYANYGISHDDMYQMYAYQKKYRAQNVTLLYPKTEKVNGGKKIEFHASEKDGSDAFVRVKFVDLLTVEALANSLGL